MKKFRFSLETVLKVRRQHEEVRRRELATAQGLRDRALLHLGSQEQGLRTLLEDLSRDRETSMDLARESWYLACWAGRIAAIDRARSELAATEQILEICRTKAVEASRDRLVLEKLEAHQLQEHQFQLNREEQGLLDDLAQRSVSAFSLPSRLRRGALIPGAS